MPPHPCRAEMSKEARLSLSRFGNLLNVGRGDHPILEIGKSEPRDPISIHMPSGRLRTWPRVLMSSP